MSTQSEIEQEQNNTANRIADAFEIATGAEAKFRHEYQKTLRYQEFNGHILDIIQVSIKRERRLRATAPVKVLERGTWVKNRAGHVGTVSCDEPHVLVKWEPGEDAWHEVSALQVITDAQATGEEATDRRRNQIRLYRKMGRF